MRILLDTHMLLWAFTNDPQLPSDAKEKIANSDNEIYYSSISTWEIALKHALHPNEIMLDENEFLTYCEQSGFKSIELNNNHVKALASLQSTEETNHKDPFDRILMAQAITEKMLFLTKDQKLIKYKNKNIIVYPYNA